MKKSTPILQFVSKRLWHIRQTLEAVSVNHLSSESDLFLLSNELGSDAAK